MRGDFAGRLRALRLARGWSQPDLALRLDVSNGSVGSWEIGPTIPRPEMVKKIAALLDTTAGFLFEGTTGASAGLEMRKSAPSHLVEDLHAELDRLDEQLAAVRRAATRLRPPVSSFQKSGQEKIDRGVGDKLDTVRSEKPKTK